MHGEQGDEQRDGPDETVSGELLPRMEADELAALRMGLQDIAHDLTGERRALALELRQLFLVLDMSVRRYAVLRHYSPSSVSRYLSGHTVAPDHFVVTLVEDVGRDKGRPLAVEARERIMSIQRAALRTSSPRAWKLQDLEDRLVAAHQEARVARTQADAVAAQLYTERQRVAGIEEERQQLADSLARHQASSGAELEVLRSEQQRIRGERDELRSRVAALEEALAAAEHRVAQAEQRCNELEGDLLAADAVEAAEAAERRGKEQAELSRLRTEVERLRQAAEPTAATAETWPEHPSRQIPEHEPGSGSGQQTLVISFAGLNRSWAAWIAAQLERRGLRVVLLRWEPAEQTPLLDLLRDLRSAEGRILLVISERYFQLETRTHEEWNGALREVVSADPHRFAAVSVSATWVPTAIAMLAPIDLTGLAEDESERRLVAGLGMPADTQHVSEQERRRGPRFPAALPEVWSGVPRRNPRFTGREMLLNLAYQMLQDAEPGAGVLTLHGMPGVGTTQLAAEYVYRFGSDYDVVWWVNSEHSTIHRQHLAELAPKLGLATGPEYGERLRAVLGSLRRGDPFARWLLVMDGADDPGQVVGMLPTGPGHVLITSRNLEWAEHRSAMLEVPAYDRHESIAFIRRRAPRLSEGDADRLADALEDLPLLIDQTAGWLDGSALSVEDYLTLLDDRPDIDAVEVSADFPVTFQTAWVDLLNKLRENAPATVDLLRLCTFFAPGPIPVRILRQMPSSELPLQLAGLIDDPLQWNRAVKQLLQYSVIRLGPSKTGDPAGIGTDTLYLHRMVHQLVNKDMPDEDRSTLLDVARRALVAADPGQPEEPRLWSQYEAVVPHLTYADVPHSEEPAVQRLLLNCLHYLSCAGHDADGAALGNQALEAWESLLDEDHSNAAELVHH
ncbi:MAG: TIR domain-containing protein, partial [Streptomyces sp.]|nr:TIR domain-containing protein [Streptomyces sp.]